MLKVQRTKNSVKEAIYSDHNISREIIDDILHIDLLKKNDSLKDYIEQIQVLFDMKRQLFKQEK